MNLTKVTTFFVLEIKWLQDTSKHHKSFIPSINIEAAHKLEKKKKRGSND